MMDSIKADPGGRESAPHDQRQGFHGRGGSLCPEKPEYAYSEGERVKAGKSRYQHPGGTLEDCI